MSFLHPEFLYYMLAPLLLLFALLLTQKEMQMQFFSKEVIKKLRVSTNSLTLKKRNILFLLIGIFIIIALAQPVIKDAKVQIQAKSADIMIALDISDSMLATDIYPNRLELAKQKVITLLNSKINQRIGVIAFAKNSYLVSPYSFDIKAVSFLLRQLDTTSITEQGTDILSILEVIKDTQKKKKKKYLLLLTDGGDKKDFTQEIKMAKDSGIVVFVLGIGTKKGAPIRLKNGEFIKQNGDIIISKLNDKISKLATSTGGVYIQGTISSNDIKEMYKEIKNNSSQKEIKSQEIQEYKQLFYYPVALALFLLVIATSSIGKQGRNITPIFLAFLILFSLDVELKAGILDFVELKKAKEAYNKGEYKKSQQLYQNYAQKNSNSAGYYNVGNSLYKQKQYKKALQAYKKANFTSSKLKAKKYANMGNAYAKQKTQKNLQKAVKAYKKSLNIQKDKEVQENLEVVKKLLQKRKKKNQQKNKKNKQKSDKKQNKQNSDNKDKQSNKNKKKSADKSKSKKNKNNSQSEKNQDKQKKSDKMKSKQQNSEKQNSKDSKKSQQKKQNLKKLDKNKNNKQEKQSNANNELKKNKMSDSEEKKWLNKLNINNSSFMYKLNTKQNKHQDSNEKPW